MYQWHGYEAPLKAKAAALLFANTIRSIDRRGCCPIHVLGNVEQPEDLDAIVEQRMAAAAAGALAAVAR